MENVYSQFNSPYSYYQEFESPYYSNTQNFETRPESTLWNLDEGIPDEAFEEAERFAKVSPSSKRDEPDDIENATLQIFTRLYSLTDGIERTEIEAAVAPINCNSPSPRRRYIRSTFHSFRDTNFYENDCEYPIHTQNVVFNVFSVLADFFLGWKLSDGRNEQKSPEETRKILDDVSYTWHNDLQEHYTDPFPVYMSSALRQAEIVLQSRQNDKQLALVQRVTFCALLIISLVGKLANQKLVTVLGLIGSSITLLFMIKHYASTYFKKFQEEADLKKAVDRVYHVALSHRRNLQSLDLSNI